MTCCPLITLTLKIISVRCIPLNLRSKTRRRATLLLPTWIGRDGQLHTSLYDKRDNFNFNITNFPFLISNIPSSPAYGVFFSQLIRHARASYSYECFLLRAVRLSNKLLGQGYVKERLRSSLRKFYGRYGNLIKQYEVPLSRMLHDILDDDHIPYIGNFSRRGIFAKTTLGRCVKFSLSPIFAISRNRNENENEIVGFIFRCVNFWRFQGGRELSEN